MTTSPALPVLNRGPLDVRACSATRELTTLQPRDPALRELYARAALAQVPRLLGAMDRNPYSPTYGCLDRPFWHYRTSDFPSEMYQEGVLALALVYARGLPGNRWHGEPRVRELAIAGMRYAARSCHRDGSCDDYYPFERALGAAVFSLQAAARAYELLELDDAELRAWVTRRCNWLLEHDESGRLANHQALAAIGLLRAAAITGRSEDRAAAAARIGRVLAWQSSEGWFEEYGGADPGYQTVTIDCLAQYRRLTAAAWLDEPLRRAVAFARLFLHPDSSYGGEYGSRGTYHFYPHGMELLAGEDDNAADLADGFLHSLASGKQAWFDDDRMFAHRLGNLIEAYGNWSPLRPPLQPRGEGTVHLPQAQIVVRRTSRQHTIISAARGGVCKRFSADHPPWTDAGLVVELTDGRQAVSQKQCAPRVYRPPATDHRPPTITVCRCVHWSHSETATPLKLAIFRLALWSVGRWCRTLVRRALQRKLITGRRECPIRLTRTFEFVPTDSPGDEVLRVTDLIELVDRRLRVRRMGYGTDHQADYVAACGVYQDSVLQPWTDLSAYVDVLNERRSVTIVREIR
jgi:hypothetical protein